MILRNPFSHFLKKLNPYAILEFKRKKERRNTRPLEMTFSFFFFFFLKSFWTFDITMYTRTSDKHDFSFKERPLSWNICILIHKKEGSEMEFELKTL